MINILYLHAGAEMYGADKVLLELVSRLDKRVFNPIIVLPSDGELVKKLKEKNVKVYVVCYPILRRNIFNVKGVVNFIFNYFKSIGNILKIVKENKIDIIHVNTVAVLEGVLLKKKLHVPLVWHVHEIIQRPKFIAGILRLIVGKFSTKIIAVSSAVKENLVQSKYVNAKKVLTIYNGIDELIFNPNNNINYLFSELDIPKESLRVGMIGRVNSWKGQDDFLSSLSPLLQKYNKLYIIMVGGVFEGQEWRFERLKEKVKDNINSSRIRVLNFRNDAENLHDFFDVFILPSINPDPLPTVVLESMASGKPIVAYKHGGVVEMVKEGENGFLVNIRDTKEMGKKIDVLLDNKDLRIKFGENSLLRERKLFSIDSYINKFQKVYKELTNK